MIFTANQLTGFYMRATMALNGLMGFLIIMTLETKWVSLLLRLHQFRGVLRTLSNICDGAFCNSVGDYILTKLTIETLEQGVKYVQS